MVHCANAGNAELVIVTRDSDYGAYFDNKTYVNDHLKQEFAERVSKKRKLLIYSRLSDALKHFQVSVTKQEEDAETEILAKPSPVIGLSQTEPMPSLIELLRSHVFQGSGGVSSLLGSAPVVPEKKP